MTCNARLSETDLHKPTASLSKLELRVPIKPQGDL